MSVKNQENVMILRRVHEAYEVLSPLKTLPLSSTRLHVLPQKLKRGVSSTTQFLHGVHGMVRTGRTYVPEGYMYQTIVTC
jgi:hypothetical protein